MELQVGKPVSAMGRKVPEKALAGSMSAAAKAKIGYCLLVDGCVMAYHCQAFACTCPGSGGRREGGGDRIQVLVRVDGPRMLRLGDVRVMLTLSLGGVLGGKDELLDVGACRRLTQAPSIHQVPGS